MAETLTSIHSLKKYDTGDNPGAAALNSNWDSIDKALLNGGAVKPTTYPVGGWFLDTAEKILYQNTGTLGTPVWTVRLSGGDPNSVVKDGSVAMTGNLNLGGQQAVNAADPTTPQALVTKAHLELRIAQVAFDPLIDPLFVNISE